MIEQYNRKSVGGCRKFFFYSVVHNIQVMYLLCFSNHIHASLECHAQWPPDRHNNIFFFIATRKKKKKKTQQMQHLNAVRSTKKKKNTERRQKPPLGGVFLTLAQSGQRFTTG
jgi:hypothetical protein